MRSYLLLSFIAVLTLPAADSAAPLLFREDWTTTPPYEEVSQEHVASRDLIQSLYGPGKGSIKKRHHGTDADPTYIFSGACPANWALTLHHREYAADLSRGAKIRWRTKMSGYRRLHIVLKLANGSWLVSDDADGESQDWHESEFVPSALHWRKLDIEKVTEGAPVNRPDLTRVEEIGFTDLMNGGASLACSRLDWIAVYGNRVARTK